MEYDLILARSVTYAQRMQRALNRAGIRSQLFRAPRDLTDLGCAYVVRISPYDLGAALSLLRRGHHLPKAACGGAGHDGGAGLYEFAGAGRASAGYAGCGHRLPVPHGAGGAVWP